jgi:hypothetical protein
MALTLPATILDFKRAGFRLEQSFLFTLAAARRAALHPWVISLGPYFAACSGGARQILCLHWRNHSRNATVPAMTGAPGQSRQDKSATGIALGPMMRENGE